MLGLNYYSNQMLQQLFDVCLVSFIIMKETSGVRLSEVKIKFSRVLAIFDQEILAENMQTELQLEKNLKTLVDVGAITTAEGMITASQSDWCLINCFGMMV